MVLTFGNYDEAVHFYAHMLEDLPLAEMTKALAAHMLDERRTTVDENGRFVVFEPNA